MTVDVLCRVVDNLGDIGFAYRLARALSELSDAPRLRLIVDDLTAFAALCVGVRADKGLQTVGDWQVARWDEPGEEAVRLFTDVRPRLVVECYACGRPEWFETILFDEGDPVPRQIINLEYLTAESWAPDYHKLPSLTRSPLVRKTMFMPGFRTGTGGLLQDTAFMDRVDACAIGESRIAFRAGLLRPEMLRTGSLRDEPPHGTATHCAEPPHGTAMHCAEPVREPPPLSVLQSADPSAFWVFVFSYEHDFSTIVADLSRFHSERPLVALVAAGRSAAPFLEAWNRAGRPFPVQALPLLPQTLWDSLLAASDFAIVRGEETLARAALLGRPFLWQCYPFAAGTAGVVSGDSESAIPTSGGQLPKVHAFLDMVRPCVSPEYFAAYERLTLAFNRSEPECGDLLAVLRALDDADSRVADRLTPSKTAGLSEGFAFWSQEVRNLGNLALNLLTFMREIG